MTGTAISTGAEYDPYAAYGESATRGLGTLLKFAKGHWSLGKEGVAVSEGTRFYANMAGIRVGWQRWDEGRPTDEIMMPITGGDKPPLRSTLGDHDKELWEEDSQGKPRDPWQFTNELPLVSVDDGEEVLFATSSKGGINAIGELCIAYSKGRKMKADGAVPIIEIGTSSYKHSDKTFGTIYTPVLKLAGWVEGELLPQAVAAPADEEPAIPPAKPAAKARF